MVQKRTGSGGMKPDELTQQRMSQICRAMDMVMGQSSQDGVVIVSNGSVIIWSRTKESLSEMMASLMDGEADRFSATAWGDDIVVKKKPDDDS